MAFTARTVVEEQGVSDKIQNAIPKYPRIEDAFEAVKWVVARSPERGHKINGFHLIKSSPWDIEGYAIITAAYTYDDDNVIISDIRISET